VGEQVLKGPDAELLTQQFSPLGTHPREKLYVLLKILLHAWSNLCKINILG
jgi:hypothetical protein